MYQRAVLPKGNMAGRVVKPLMPQRTPVDARARPARAPDQTALEASTLRRGHDFSLIPVHGLPQDPADPAALHLREAAPVGGEFPHRTLLERRLGASIPGWSIVDPDACRSKAVPAFTSGGISVFASAEPSLRVAAHEAAHQLQHTGRTGDGGLGAERHAATVAELVGRGEDASILSSAGGSPVPAGLHCYTEIPADKQGPGKWDARSPVRVSGDEMMAVRQDEPQGSKKAWADPTLITTASNMLATARSVLRLASGAGTLTGPTRWGGLRTLKEVVPENVKTKTKGAAMELWADCGRSARDVMGAGGGTGWGDMVAQFTSAGKPVLTAKGSAPEGMKNEIMQKLLGGASQRPGEDTSR